MVQVMLHGAQCRWCTEAMQGGSSARCWQSTRCIPPCSRSAVYLGRSCAKHQVCWKASRRARIPRGGICPRERRLTFPSLGCRNNTGAHPALSLGQKDPPPPPPITPPLSLPTCSALPVKACTELLGLRPGSEMSPPSSPPPHGASLVLMCIGGSRPPLHGEHSPKWGRA